MRLIEPLLNEIDRGMSMTAERPRATAVENFALTRFRGGFLLNPRTGPAIDGR